MTSKNQPRVLIIEDHDVLRVLLFTLLRHQPLDVDTAASASEALLKVASCDYALIVIDLDMTGEDVASFVRQFRARRPDTTTFILGVRNPREEPAIDLTLVSATLTKPIELDMLANVVRETAAVIPLPPNPLPCPPAESNVRDLLDRDSSIPN